MNKFSIINALLILLIAKATFAQSKNETVEIFFEPSLTVCHKTENQLFDCEPVQSEESSHLKINLVQSVIVSGIEVWGGEASREMAYKDYKAKFQVHLTMQKAIDRQEKSYEFHFFIKDSLSGATTYTVATDDLGRLNSAQIELPEVKMSHEIYFVSLKFGQPQEAKIQIQENIPLFEVDDQIHYLIGDQVIEKESLGEANIQGTRPVRVDLWEDGILPVVFKDDVTQKIKDLIWAACEEWSRAAQVKCVPGPYKNRQLVVSRKYLAVDGGCWSMLGQSAYFLWVKRRMNIGQGCDTYAVILHELGHALGIGHEHQRPDRDNYIQILKENISDPFLGLNTKMNFSTQNGETLVAYDFLSIMHYFRTAFSKNGKDTMVPRQGYEQFANVMGHAQHLSELDKVSLQKLYGKK